MAESARVSTYIDSHMRYSELVRRRSSQEGSVMDEIVNRLSEKPEKIITVNHPAID